MIRDLKASDRPKVESLLANNPFKADQVRIQGLDPGKLLKFHADRVLSRVGREADPVLFLEKDGDFGLVGIQEAQTHSVFFEKLVFSISPVLSYTIGTERKAALLHEALDRIQSRGAEVVWIQFAEEESDWVSVLAGVGGACCGTTLRLTRSLAGLESSKGPSDWVIRRAESADLSAVEAIAEKGHAHSHFFRDPFLPEWGKRRLFPDYLRKSHGQPLRELWIAEEPGGDVLGFSLLILPAGQEEVMGRKVGVLDFIVVDPSAQGRGVGRGLLDQTHRRLADEGFEFVELKTLLDNRPAVNFYMNEGYRLISSEVHFSLSRGG